MARGMSATEERRRLLDERVVDLTNVSTKTVKELTSSEAVECLWGLPVRERIVRCGDCKHCREHDMRAYGGDRDQLLCHHFSMSSGARWPVEPDGFCKWGVRRADG